jgi:hypothetical protein
MLRSRCFAQRSGCPFLARRGLSVDVKAKQSHLARTHIRLRAIGVMYPNAAAPHTPARARRSSEQHLKGHFAIQRSHGATRFVAVLQPDRGTAQRLAPGLGQAAPMRKGTEPLEQRVVGTLGDAIWLRCVMYKSALVSLRTVPAPHGSRRSGILGRGWNGRL